MEYLPKDWLTQGLIDFEYKKYVLLAYLKKVRENFEDMRLYPFLSELLTHYHHLMQLKQNKTLFYSQFPKRISRADFEKLKVVYQQIVDDDDIMKELEDILSFALPEINRVLQQGKSSYEEVESSIWIENIGISPLYKNEGYFFLDMDFEREVQVYRYQVTVFENTQEKFRGIHVQWLHNFTKQIGKTFESVKLELINAFRELPNPATFRIFTERVFPIEPTILPVAKRLLVKHIGEG